MGLQKVVVGLCLTLAGVAASAQSYPNKRISLVLGFASGGGGDAIVYPVTQALSQVLGQAVTVDHRAGAGGTVATSQVAAAAPDGYTVYLTSAGHYGTDQLIHKHLKYTAESLVPIGRWVQSSLIIAVRPGSGIHSLADLLNRARAQPEKVSCSTAGVGTPPHLALGAFEQQAGVKILHVPAKGSAPAAAMVVSGDVDCVFGSPPSVIALAQAGRLKMIAVTAEQRLPQFPELITVGEGGLSAYRYTYWWGLFGPAGLPKDIVDRLFTAANAALQSPSVLKAVGEQPGYLLSPSSSPAEFASWAESEGLALKNLSIRLGLAGR
jgi:tripartite-type tricarboxylate transporter receptor subunit TctC